MLRSLTIICMLVTLCSCARLNWWGGDGVTVVKGDTLYSISRSYGVPIKELINANHLSAPYTLYVGQKLRLPSKHYHIVRRGESLYSISRMHNVDITSLSKVNNLQTPYSLSVGQKLLLPASVSSYSSGYMVQSKTNKSTSAMANNVHKNTNKSSAAEKYIAPAATRKSKFVWPVTGTVISGYGNLGSGRKNDGINIKAALGTAVKAGDAGTVAYAGNELKGFGNLILIKHADGWITAYAHNDKLLVKKGQKVSRGEKIATVGSTGSVTTPQLHFEVRSGKRAVNPRTYLP